MKNAMQLPLLQTRLDTKENSRSGTFLDNMKLPIHRWFRYSAGFSAAWVEQTLEEMNFKNSNKIILDPFAGSGTTMLAADWFSIKSVGIEAHPFVSRIAKSKFEWASSIDKFFDRAEEVLSKAQTIGVEKLKYPDLINKCYEQSALEDLDRFRRAWIEINDGSPASELMWLAITSILRPTSSVGTAQWQYILPKKKKKVIAEPLHALEQQINIMASDMSLFQKRSDKSLAEVLQSDARHCAEVEDNLADLVITSPPYANNYDYADATRLEMSFWGEVQSWGDLHAKVRQYLVRSCSQHVSKDKSDLEELLASNELLPIASEIKDVCNILAEVRLLHGGKKHYHTMIAAYFWDMARVWIELRRICKSGAVACFVIGDSAPYGVYVPVDDWLGRLAVAAGFKNYSFEKLRDRNVKWKNRKHRVPLKEGRLWVEG